MTTGQCPATVFFGRNNIPEYINQESQDTELDSKDREMKEKMKDRADKVRKSRVHEIKEGDTVLLKNLWKRHKLSPNWSNERFKVVKGYKKSALIESEDQNRCYRNKAHLKKYNRNESHKERNFAKEQLQSKEQDDEVKITLAMLKVATIPLKKSILLIHLKTERTVCMKTARKMTLKSRTIEYQFSFLMKHPYRFKAPDQ